LPGIVNEAIELARTREDLLEAAVLDHARLVYRITYSVLRNHHDAEDATQETFVRVLRARTKLTKVADVRNWLARIAWRVVAERRKKSSQVLTEEIAVDPTPRALTPRRKDGPLIGYRVEFVLSEFDGERKIKLPEVFHAAPGWSSQQAANRRSRPACPQFDE
jgi:RNA polymerase sigma factor (sigma-70 family)